MLPVLILEPDESMRAMLADALSALRRQNLPATRIEMSTGSPSAMRHAIEAQSGIALAILGIPPGAVVQCAELGNLAMQRNRSSYTLFCLHDAGDLGDLLENCLRPAGILTAPISQSSLSKVLTRILTDYQALIGDTPGNDDCMVVEAGGTAYRISYDEILYLEALDKLLTIHTRRQQIAVRRSLSALEGTLPDTFIRCHRAYILNSRYIDQVDYSNMSLTLSNGDVLPISRGQRTEVRKRFDAGKGANA